MKIKSIPIMTDTDLIKASIEDHKINSLPIYGTVSLTMDHDIDKCIIADQELKCMVDSLTDEVEELKKAIKEIKNELQLYRSNK